MKEIHEIILQSLDDHCLPAIEVLQDECLSIAIGIERIDREEFDKILHFGNSGSVYRLSYAEYGSIFETENFYGIEELWQRYTEIWTSNCIFSNGGLSIIQTATERFFVAIAEKSLMSAVHKEFSIMNSDFEVWTESPELSDNEKKFFKSLAERFSRLML